MYFRNFSVALVSTLVASGAWYAYKGGLVPGTGLSVNSSSSSNSRSFTGSSVPANAFSSTSQENANTATHEATNSKRRALVVDDDQFFTEEILGNQPLTKTTDASGRLTVEMLTLQQATQKLRKNEESFLVGRGQGVIRYDTVQLASNNPIEDDHVERIVEGPNVAEAADDEWIGHRDWMFWGVFDGHSGWTTSAKLRQMLVPYVGRELHEVFKSPDAKSSITSQSIDAAIRKSFLRLDHEIVHESVEKVMKANSRRVAAELLAPALSGSCALLSFYDSRTKLLKVACTGDSRAVLGRRGSSGKWIATALSEDQTGATPSEVTRLRREHPGEEYVTKNGRILGGLEPSRAFGDAVYKWSKSTADRMKSTFFGRSQSYLMKTPPYVTAEPIITTTKIDPSKNDFLVMATDGLWECLTNEEVVGLVGQWLDSPKSDITSSGNKGNKSTMSAWFGRQKTALPVEKAPQGQNGDDEGQKSPIRVNQWQINEGDERFVVEDKNAATHLVRNALGGKNEDMLCALLTLPAPHARRYRDDLTVQVIFFGDGEGVDSIVRNSEASFSYDPINPKL